MTEDDLIVGILKREGGRRDRKRRPDGTWDPDTNRGITFPTLKAWRARQGRPVPVLADLWRLSAEEAAEIYREEYVRRPGFTRENIPFEPLRVQLIDFGVNSGQATAVRWLQRVLWMAPEEVDGKFGPKTAARLRLVGEWGDDTFYRLVNDALVGARSYMIDRATDTGTMRKEDEEGVESRALSFFLARP